MLSHFPLFLMLLKMFNSEPYLQHTNPVTSNILWSLP